MQFQFNELQIAYLKRIRWVRTLFILRTIGALLLLPIFIILLIGCGEGFPDPNWMAWKKQFSGPMIFISITVLLLLIPFLFVFLIRWIPLQKDLNSAKGLNTQKKIIAKRHFPITNEFFFFFEESYVPNIKIDGLTFSHYAVGDYFSVKMTKRSKIVFEDYDRFDIV